MVRHSEKKLSCECPNGHKLRGPVSLIGRQIECPKCNARLIFGETYNNSVSDTAVVRILDSTASVQPSSNDQENESRPCHRCGSLVSSTASVCDHCDCYVGVMPDFMKTMNNESRM